MASSPTNFSKQIRLPSRDRRSSTTEVPPRHGRRSATVLEQVRFEGNSDDFIFDNEMLVQCHALGFRIAEITCPTSYFAEASSINFWRSVKYGLGCLRGSAQYFLHRVGVRRSIQFQPKAP